MNPVRSRSIAITADSLDRNPNEDGRKSASNTRLQHDLRGLRHPVADRHAQRPLAAVWFRDVRAPGGRGTVRALAQVSLKFRQEPRNPVPTRTGLTPVSLDQLSGRNIVPS
jgi:hypothetical protein